MPEEPSTQPPAPVEPVIVPAPEPPVEPTQTFNPFGASADQPTTPLVSPAVTETPAEPLVAPVVAVTKPKKFKTPLLIGGIVAAALVIFGGGSALAYNVWYQNPDKVVGDAIVNAITAKSLSATGTVEVSSDDYTMKVEASAKSTAESDASVAVKLIFTSDEINFDVDGEGIFSADGDLYVKLNDAKKLADSIEEQADGAVDFTAFDDIITKIDSKWIKIGKDDLGDFGEEYEKTQKCYADISKSLETDDAFRKSVEKETYALYKENQFIVVGDKLGSRTIGGQGSLGYKLTGDAAAADKFFTALGDSTFGKKVKECDDTVKFDDIVDATDDDSDTTTEAEIWISRFGHSITEVNATFKDDESKGSFVLNPVFNTNESIAIPTDVIPFTELQADIEKAYEDYYASYYEDYSYDSYDTSATEATDTSSLFN